MTLVELKQHIVRLIETGHGDWKVVVDLDQPSVGAGASTDVKMIYPGFDWQYGQIRICTTNKIIEKSKDRDLNIPKSQSSEFSKKYVCCSCGFFVRKGDNYCSICGQNIKGVKE